MRVQAGEEHGHALKIYDFVNDRDGRVILAEIEAPKTEWKSPLDVFEEALKHEQKITGLINDLSNLAFAEKDHACHDFLEWFVKEQVEEESVARTIVDQLKLVGNDGTGLYMIDQKLSQRATAPSPAPAT
jgi:ferritin